MKILVTGAAGFVGRNLCSSLLTLGHSVHGLDNVSDVFDQAQLKRDRLYSLTHPNFHFYHVDISDSANLEAVFEMNDGFDVVVNLAAQPGVKQSETHPELFTASNLVGFANVLEACRKFKIPHTMFASSSSVYGEASWACDEETPTDSPKCYYAATKKANEVMAASYANAYGMRITGIRFFTLFGPWGRPDMAAWKFTEAILNNRPVTMYNGGSLSRDWTYIDDAVKCLVAMIEQEPKQTKSSLFQIYNVCSSRPILVNEFVRILEEVTGHTAVKIQEPASVCEVRQTFGDMEKFEDDYDMWVPRTTIKVALTAFVEWYKAYDEKCVHRTPNCV